MLLEFSVVTKILFMEIKDKIYKKVKIGEGMWNYMEKYMIN